jgi:hypothetical protein
MPPPTSIEGSDSKKAAWFGGIATLDCLAVLHSIKQHDSNETAKRCLGVIGQRLNYAVAIGHDTINPAHSPKQELNNMCQSCITGGGLRGVKAVG